MVVTEGPYANHVAVSGDQIAIDGHLVLTGDLREGLDQRRHGGGVVPEMWAVRGMMISGSSPPAYTSEWDAVGFFRPPPGTAGVGGKRRG